jgi:hypothetical protein
MGNSDNMNNIMGRTEGPDVQAEFADLVNETLKKEGITLTRLAQTMGMDGPQLSRAINGKRKFTYAEVVRISQSLGICPPTWKTIGNVASESRFLPLCGEIAASVWRAKGFGMATFLSPIRPIDLGDGDTREQLCYLIGEGAHHGEYAVCVTLKADDELADGDVIVVEETRLMPPHDTEISRIFLATVKRTDDGFLLLPICDAIGGEAMRYPDDGISIKGLLIGVFRAWRKKNNTKTTT